MAPVALCPVIFCSAFCFACPSVAPIAKCISITATGSTVISTAARYYLSYNLKRYCHANGYRLHYGDGGELIIRDMPPDSCESQHLNVVTAQPTMKGMPPTYEEANGQLPSYEEATIRSQGNPNGSLTALNTSPIASVHTACRQN
ncbi:hypothetical protein [Candidatus Mesenet endosymbiont of Phosphuga atrata]|uniref:hypothetical protein n=1 Tax=Candidatus Mesenet endosymbiont of Phosphuga atrata TaxID=3066221 RepID=UPI0030D4C27F